VQNVDDPELAELIGAAIENQAKFRRSTQEETLELTRTVTLSYTRIKLLDEQIRQVYRKIEANTGPAEMRNELRLAKMELESKLLEEVADLRKAMGITPRHPFEIQPIEGLSSWVILRVLDQGVYVLDSLQPFREYWARQRNKSLGLQSRKEALDYVREQLKDPNNFPIRIDHSYTADMSSAAKDLRDKVVSLAREANCQMEVEASLTLLDNIGSGVSTFFIREGTISTLHKAGPLKRPDGGLEPLGTGVVEPNDLEQHIMWRLLRPKIVPLKFRIEHDETSSRLARQTADKVRIVAKDLGIGELVDVERILIEAVPESAFLGRWQAITKGEVQTIDIKPTGVCVFVQNSGSKPIRGGMSVPGRWFLTPKEMFMDIKDIGMIKDMGKIHHVYRGNLDKEGHLVVDRGEIHVEGSFGTWKTHSVVFQKVY
jgi:hypothetical protein